MNEIYQRDPEPRPDTDFAPGEYRHLVEGNAGRMLDHRRTPMRIVALAPEIASWICEVTGFEDRGAKWTLPFESIAHFQFPHDATEAGEHAIVALEEQIQRFDVPLIIEPDPERAKATRQALERRRTEAATWISERTPTLREVATIDHVGRRAPLATLVAFETFMLERDLLDIDHALSHTYVSNPGSGETVRGHQIVLAEMGIATYRGRITRDPATFQGIWRRSHRVDHILWRTAFVQAMLAALGLETLELFRGVSNDGGIDPGPRDPLESWSFNRAVAEGVAAAEGERAHRMIHALSAPHRRAFMTYLETRAMNRQFLEAEAVLFAEAVIAER